MKYKKEAERLFKAKRLFHKELAEKPFEEKIKILIQLQKLANNIMKKKKMVWRP